MSRRPDGDVARDVVVPFRLTPDEAALLARAVKRAGTESRSEFIRAVILETAERIANR